MNVVVVALALAMVVAMSASDPGTWQDFCIADLGSWTRVNGYVCCDRKKATNDDFVYLGLHTGSDTRKEFGGPTKRAFVQEWRALNTPGISWRHVNYAVNGLNNLHLHSCASKILYCQQGTLFVEFVDSTNNHFWYKTLQPGDVVRFLRGLLHFQLNIGKVPALAHKALKSQNGGVQHKGHCVLPDHPRTHAVQRVRPRRANRTAPEAILS